jgi:hypothetical protein
VGIGVELPSIIDQEEIEERERRQQDKMMRTQDRLGLKRDPDFDKIDNSNINAVGSDGGVKFNELKKIIGQYKLRYYRNLSNIYNRASPSFAHTNTCTSGIPSTWASSDFLKGREWWIQSKKRGEGGDLEHYIETYPFENYSLLRGHIAFNKFGKRRYLKYLSGSSSY